MRERRRLKFGSEMRQWERELRELATWRPTVYMHDFALPAHERGEPN